MDMPINAPVDNPNADTEWNDILRKHGVLPPKPPSPTKEIEEALIQARQLAHQHRLEGKDLDELGELEDDEDDEFLEIYRRKRVAEIEALRLKSKHGRVYPIQKPEWSKEVTEASKGGSFVFVLLRSNSGGNTESRLLSALWRPLAEKYAELKFCEIVASMAIEGYPERNCPTVLVYKDEEVVKQLVTLKELGGVTTKLRDLENFLIKLNVIQPSDQRLRDRDEESDGDQSERRGIARTEGKQAAVEDDDDWD